jgi:CdiI immunity protein
MVLKQGVNGDARSECDPRRHKRTQFLLSRWIPNSAMNDTQREMLMQFFGGYFHQDWDLDALNPDAVISEFCGTATSKEKLSLSRGITKYVASINNDQELDSRLFQELACYYEPEKDGCTTRACLEHVTSMLARC